MLSFDGVSKSFAGPRAEKIHALSGVDLEWRDGETLCLLGPSGSGKSTTLRLCNGLLVPDTGRVTVDGRPLAEHDPLAMRRGMGLVVQEGGLFPHWNVAENIGLLARLEGWDRGRLKARVDELLDLVRLDPRRYARRRPNELSGGERQRVALARALVLDPPRLLLDEPFSALDPGTRRALRAEFRELSALRQKSVLLVTHDLSEAEELADRIALFSEGRILQTGPFDELRDHPADERVANFFQGRVA